LPWDSGTELRVYVYKDTPLNRRHASRGALHWGMMYRLPEVDSYDEDDGPDEADEDEY
jgi:hypothetical protein